MDFDTNYATATYIDSLGAEALEQAISYTAGNHWLMAWSLLITAAVTWLIVRSKMLVYLSKSISKKSFLAQSFLICAAYIVISSIIELPWIIYSNWFREIQYGSSNQPIGDFLSQISINLTLNSLFNAIIFTGCYIFIRRSARYWWAWLGSFATSLFFIVVLIQPVVIEPLFNDYQPLPEGEVKNALEELAIGAGIAADRIFTYDGSRQSNNFSANVSGLGSTARIAISDIALTEANLEEVKAVTGHEIGHYVSGHIWSLLFMQSAQLVIVFLIASKFFAPTARVFGSSEDIANPIGIPVLILLVGMGNILTQPLANTLSRMHETDADRYSLKVVNLPDALASALIKTAEYRNPRPRKIEEWIFYSHPSVENRVRLAMEWKSDKLKDQIQ